MAQVLHLTGPVLVGRTTAAPGVGGRGRITYAPPGDPDVCGCRVGAAGLVDAHATSASARTARSTTPPPRAGAGRPGCGTLLIRDAGSPADTRWVRTRRPAAAHPGRPAHRPHPPLHPQLRPGGRAGAARRPGAAEARAGDGWVKLVGDWIDRDTGDLSPCWPADVLARRWRLRTRRAPGSPRTASARSRCPTWGRGHRLRRARLRAAARHRRGRRRPGRRDRADTGQHREC